MLIAGMAGSIFIHAADGVNNTAQTRLITKEEQEKKDQRDYEAATALQGIGVCYLLLAGLGGLQWWQERKAALMYPNMTLVYRPNIILPTLSFVTGLTGAFLFKFGSAIKARITNATNS